MNKGKLYVISTPIGNLEDITLRAIEKLKEVSFILAEDTRESKKLLNKYDIKTQLVSYRDQNHERMIEKITEKLNMGLDLGLVSDSGTPLISDPGFKLVQYLKENYYDVISIPGPSALTAALSISGLPTDRFVFLGFLPKSDERRKKILDEYKELHNTIIIYESPKRLLRLLALIQEQLGEINIFLAKDISKLREKSYSGKISKIIQELKTSGFEENPHGEFVCVISPTKD